jgi:hypothetical protein
MNYIASHWSSWLDKHQPAAVRHNRAMTKSSQPEIFDHVPINDPLDPQINGGYQVTVA